MATKDDIFPFRRVFNFKKLVDFWRELAVSEPPAVAEHAKSILAMLDSTPELLGEELDPEIVKKYSDVVSILMSPVIPIGHSEKSISAAIPPYQLECFFATKEFVELDLIEGMERNLRISGVSLPHEGMAAARAISAYTTILREFADIRMDWDFPFVVTRIDPETGLNRHFKIEFDFRFMEVKKLGDVKPLTDEQIDRLLGEKLDLNLWTQALPPQNFQFHGFVILDVVEVTVQEELSLLKDDLLRPGSLVSAEQIDGLENRLRVILRRPELRLGVIGLVKSEFGAIEDAVPIGRSLLLTEAGIPKCQNKEHSFYAKAFKDEIPVIVSNLEHCQSECTGFEFHLMHQGLKNLLVAPLLYEDERVGILELASPNPGDITSWNSGNLLQVTQLFATALNREMRERDNEIQAVVKKHYTAIHPVVEWRFRESATNYLERLERDGRADKEEIVFNDVYPLYGLSDIRGSSTHRVESIRDDLLLQLRLALDVVQNAAIEKGLPVIDELRYQLERHLELINQGLGSGDEVSVLDFLHEEIEGRLDHLSSFGDAVAASVRAYREALDPRLGVVYQSRKAYEQSIGRINEVVIDYLERENERAQAMFPHYFERYQTDGVDYNIYVGNSLVRDGGFDPLYLRNLRLWQLMTTCGIVWEMNDLKPSLPVELDTAHLVLVQSTPLAIRFREDEKQFDVDGAYNARYEIVKKRIDKARIKATGERLTQPGQIAIVYSQAREAAEYRRYLTYLQAVGYLEAGVEDVELEDLQGVHGLRALRVTVAPNSPEIEIEVTPEGEMRSVKKPGSVAV